MKRLSTMVFARLYSIVKSLLAQNSGLYKLFFLPGFEKWRWHIGRRLALAAYYRALAETPAYRDFAIGQPASLLEEVPVMDKENYVKRYSIERRCISGKISSKGVIIDESSGSTGLPTNWVRGKKEREENKQALRHGLNHLLGRRDKFIINAFALGSWATGINITLAFEDEAILKSPGPDAVKIENTLSLFGKNYHYVIMGYPPFLKLLADSKEIDFRKYDVTFIFGGEGMSEHMRRYFFKKGVKRVYGSLGASDLELNIGAENDFTIRLRQLIADNEKLAGRLLQHKGYLPMVFQYNPMDFYIETNTEGELLVTLCRENYLSPKVRYNIHDLGHVVRLPRLFKILNECGIDPVILGKPVADLPLLLHYGRSDMSVAYFGCKISPQHIQEVIFRNNTLAESISSFTIRSYEDERLNKRLSICFELTEHKRLNTMIPKEAGLAALILNDLKLIHQDFRESIKMVAKGNEPAIEFYESGQGPFKNGDIRIKSRYIS